MPSFFFGSDKSFPGIKTSLKQVEAMIIFGFKVLRPSMFNCNFFPCTEMTVRQINYDHFGCMKLKRNDDKKEALLRIFLTCMNLTVIARFNIPFKHNFSFRTAI